MRAPISGICVGMRMIKGTRDSSDFAKVFVCQPADKNHDAALIEIYVQEISIIEILLKKYAKGDLRWIDLYCAQVPNGRETIWICERVYDIALSPTPSAENDGRTISGNDEYSY